MDIPILAITGKNGYFSFPKRSEGIFPLPEFYHPKYGYRILSFSHFIIRILSFAIRRHPVRPHFTQTPLNQCIQLYKKKAGINLRLTVADKFQVRQYTCQVGNNQILRAFLKQMRLLKFRFSFSTEPF